MAAAQRGPRSGASARDLPKPRRANPVPGLVLAFSTANYQLVDVHTNYISGGLNSIYVVPLQAKPLINILHTL